MAYVDWKKLKARVPIADVIGHYGLTATLRPTAKGFEGACPFCGSTSFKVNTEKNVWFCFGECKTTGGLSGGNILDFVARKENVSLSTAATLIASWEDSEAPTGGEHKTKEGVGAVEPEPPPKGAPTRAQAAPGTGGVPEPLPPPGTSTPGHPGEPIPEGAVNKPLGFALKHLLTEHPALDAIGSPSARKHFGVGYMAGKGTMHGRIVFPIYNLRDELLAYIGYSPEDGSFKIPKDFDPRLEIFGLPFGVGDYDLDGPLIVTTNPTTALKLYGFGFHEVVGILSTGFYPPQVEIIRALIKDAGRIDFVPESADQYDWARPLTRHFYVRVHECYRVPKDEFIPCLTDAIGW